MNKMNQANISELNIGSLVRWNYEHHLNSRSVTQANKEAIVVGFHGSTNLVRIHIFGTKVVKDVNVNTLSVEESPKKTLSK